MSVTAPDDAFLDVNDAHLRVFGNVHADGLKLGQLEVVTTTSTGSTIQFLHQHTAFTTSSNIEVGTTNHDLFVDTNTSRVGILTNTPTTALDVNGTVKATAFDGDGALLTGIPSSAINGTLSQWTTVTGPKIHYSDGNVGIGIADPLHTLDVVGDINFTGTLREDGNPFVSTPWTIETSPTALSYTGGNVGIGAATPSAKLEVTGNAHVTTDLSVGGTLSINTITAAATHALSAVTAVGASTGDTLQLTNATTGLVTTGNVSVGKELTVAGNVAVDTDTLFVDSVNNRVGVGTTNPQEKFHLYGAPMIQHSTVYDTANTPGWFKIGEWDPTNMTGARLKISFLGGNGYSSGLKERGGETILYATCNNNSPSNKANIEGMIHAHGNAVVTQVKFKHLDNSRHKFEIRAFVESYSQMAMKIECTQTDTFTKYFTSSTDLGGETVDISHAIFTHEFDNDGSLLIGTTSPYYSQRFQVSGGHSRFESGPYSRSQGKRYNYNFQTSGNNNHTLTIPITGASSRGIMKLKINVIQVAANSSGTEIAELEGYISAYGGTHGITATKALKINSIYAEHICSSGTSSGNLKIYYRPIEGYLQDVSVMFDIELQLGASFAHAGSLSHVLSSSNAGLATEPTFNTTRYEIDGYVSVPVSLSFDGTNWITVTSGGSHLGTGTWIVQAYIHSAGSAGSGQLYDETYSGIFTWYSGGTNSTVANDIALHNAGHAPNGEVISMRTRRTGSGGGVNLVFEIKSNVSWGGTARTTYFAFRRLL